MFSCSRVSRSWNEKRYFEISGFYYVLTQCHVPKVTDQASLRNRHVRAREQRSTTAQHPQNFQTREPYR